MTLDGEEANWWKVTSSKYVADCWEFSLVSTVNYSSWKGTWLRLIIGAAYIFEGPVNSLLTTGSDFYTGPSCLTALLFHSIFAGTLLHQKGTRLPAPDYLAPALRHIQTAIISRPPVVQEPRNHHFETPRQAVAFVRDEKALKVIFSPLFCFLYNLCRQFTGLVATFCRNTNSISFKRFS